MPKKQKKQRFLSYIGLFSILLLVGFILLLTLFSSPVNPRATESVRFVIPKGQAVSTIGKRLQEEGLIRNHWIFRFVVGKEGLGNKLQAGSFDLLPSMTIREIAEELTQGTQDIWVTIPEGWRREEIAESMAKQELETFDEEEFLRLTLNLEGRLFPDTYLVPRQMPTDQLVTLLSQTFERKVTKGLANDITAFTRRYEYAFEEALIMASIVEREARGYEQMRQVAGALWNRMDIGMALQVDASLQYIKGYSATEKTWWPTPLSGDKELNSVYNTYKYAGLPPQPIANPGIDAIRATLNPVSHNYLFYLHDRTGEIHFATTLEQHNQNVETYLR